ncbi:MULTISPECIES: carbohydrate-binding protein [Priestia]|uniref:hypothetical protein n=1 Tax=Priestia TaxID=2800373 RepID=UPI0017847882|nr:hypothetical protein [Priestia megaterium]MCF6798184.1 hypothetical protein [Bacillus sp. ET1]MBD8843078.1 hypothetical protein [Priestia megaterium]MDN4864365.1 hypothetical protein [Priestia megaterium]MED3811816.1 hypothetical protein [Priestia megaterium]MED3828147.1 hypothetical protein [Priestia megaterium]
MRLLLTTALCVVSLLGCNHDKPKPETKISSQLRAAETFGAMNTKPSLMVHQHVKGQNVYVECILSGFSFSTESGFLQIKVDGKPFKEMKQAAFVLSDLPKGSHTVTIELMKSKEESYQVRNTFTVEII